MREIKENLELAQELKNKSLILDIETWSDYDIKSNFDMYVNTAKVRFVGMYSYITNKFYNIRVTDDSRDIIKRFIERHDTIITFNGDGFDIPILKNNYMYPNKNLISLDMNIILGNNKQRGHKLRGMLMGYKFKDNSLRTIAKTMNLDVQKGDIDYKIFQKQSYTPHELDEIFKYLKADVEVTKQMFEKTYDFWLPFVNMISKDNIKKWSFLNVSIASLVYKTICNLAYLPEEYGEHGEKQDIGGRVIEPKVEEARNLWYFDITSLYPHLYVMFNLSGEVYIGGFSGNDMFKVNGCYNNTEQSRVTKVIYDILKERIRLKKEDPDNPMVYALKIVINTIYGCSRSPVFKSLYTPNAGVDCCLLGQQVHRFMEEELKNKGYDVVAGDTDGLMCVNSKVTKEEAKKHLEDIKNKILDNVPFKAETFNIDIETGDKIEYMMWVKNYKTNKYNKKNYIYIYKKNGERKVKIMGLPIKKSNATKLGMLIYKKYLEQEILNKSSGKFEKDYLIQLIKQEVEKDISLMAIEYKCNEYNSYSPAGKCGLNAQISLKYLSGKSGRIKLIKNKRVGQVGNKFKYCTIKEAQENNLTYKDLDLTKIFNELEPFTRGELEVVKTKTYF